MYAKWLFCSEAAWKFAHISKSNRKLNSWGRKILKKLTKTERKSHGLLEQRTQTTTTYIQDEMLVSVNLRKVLKGQIFSEFLSDEGSAQRFMLSVSMSLFSLQLNPPFIFNQVGSTSKLGKKLGAERAGLYCHSNWNLTVTGFARNLWNYALGKFTLNKFLICCIIKIS